MLLSLETVPQVTVYFAKSLKKYLENHKKLFNCNLFPHTQLEAKLIMILYTSHDK